MEGRWGEIEAAVIKIPKIVDYKLLLCCSIEKKNVLLLNKSEKRRGEEEPQQYAIYYDAYLNSVSFMV